MTIIRPSRLRSSIFPCATIKNLGRDIRNSTSIDCFLLKAKKLMSLKFDNFTSQWEVSKECDVDAIISSIFIFSQLWKI